MGLKNNMNPLKFLQKLLERSVKNDNQYTYLKQSNFYAKSLTWIIIVFSGFSIGWLCIAKTEEIIVSKGKLTPIGDVKIIQFPSDGVISKILVKDGDIVEKGDLLITLDNEKMIAVKENLLNNIDSKKEQIRLKNLELKDYVNLNNVQSDDLFERRRIQTVILDKFEYLHKEGAISELQYLEKKKEVEKLKGELNIKKADLPRQSGILRQELENYNLDLEDLKMRLKEITINLNYKNLRSPVDGVVFDLKPKSLGYVAQTNLPLMKLVPLSNIQASIEIDSNRIGFVRLGNEVDISIDSYPASDFGVIKGSIKHIGSDTLSPDNLNRNYRFPAQISLSSQTLRLKDGKELPLQVGMSLTANIKLRKVTYIQLLLSEFKQKTDSIKKL